MEEVEEHVNEVVMIGRDRPVLHDEPKNLLSLFNDMACLNIVEPNEFRKLLESEAMLNLVEKVVDLGTTTSIYVRKDGYSQLLDALHRHGVEFRVRKCTLRDAFLWWTV